MMLQIPLEPLHRFHPYCARFPSQIVEAALERYTKPGDSVFDPFCGSGTTLVASLAHGRQAVGADIDLLAGMLSEAKCTPLAPAQYAAWRAQFAERLTRAFTDLAQSWRPRPRLRPGTMVSIGTLKLPIPTFPELTYWFPPQVIAALSTIAEAAHQCQEPHYERAALLSLSACIIAKWPKTLSYAMDIDHTRPHRRVQRFTLDRVLMTYLQRLDRTLGCLGTLHHIYHTTGLLDRLHEYVRIVYPHNAREPLPVAADESQAAVITSPPYFNAVDYPRAHRMSVCWMNGYAPTALASRQHYIGLRYAGGFAADTWLQTHPKIRRLLPMSILVHAPLVRRLCAFFADLEAVLKQSWRVLRPGGHAVFVIANNVIKGQRIASHAILAELARNTGFVAVETTPRAIAERHRRFPVGPFGFDGPMTHEYLVVFRKLQRSISSIGGTGMPPRFDSSHLLKLHGRLCDGDRTASEELAELVLNPLVEQVARRYPRTDEQMIWDGVSEAFLDYCSRPYQFDASHGVSLDRFLHMASWRNVANILRRNVRRLTHEEEAARTYATVAVELDPVVGNLLQQEESAQLHQQEEGFMGLLQDPKDRQILALRLQGERRTEAFAAILGISHLPIEGQRREVKRAKDRIDKILRRKGGRP
jgi:DNA modification methylase